MSIFGSGMSFFSIPEAESKIFTIQKVEKKVRSHISEKDREKRVLEIFKQARKEIKELDKKLSGSRKKFKKLQAQKSTQSVELENIFQNSEAVRKQVQSVLVAKRLEVRAIFTENEWDAFIAEGLEELQRDTVKASKENNKIKKSDRKFLTRLQKVINREIAEPQRRSKAMESYNRFEEKVSHLTEESINYTDRNNDVLSDYKANKSMLETVFEALNYSREQAITAFLVMREELVALLTEKEWKKVSKALNSVF